MYTYVSFGKKTPSRKAPGYPYTGWKITMGRTENKFLE